MALIICPNCKSENISDNESVCPVCGIMLNGFDDNTKAHSSQAEKNERNSAQLRDERLNDVKRSLLPELKKELADIDNMPIPDKPRFIYSWFNKVSGARISTYLFFACLVLSLVFFFVLRQWVIVFGVLTVFLLCFSVITAIKEYRKSLSEYYYITDDFDYYKENLKNKVRREYNERAQNIAVHKSTEKPDLISTWS